MPPERTFAARPRPAPSRPARSRPPFTPPSRTPFLERRLITLFVVLVAIGAFFLGLKATLSWIDRDAKGLVANAADAATRTINSAVDKAASKVDDTGSALLGKAADKAREVEPDVLSHCRTADNQPVLGMKFLPPGTCCTAQGLTGCTNQLNCAYCQYGNYEANDFCTVDGAKYPHFVKSTQSFGSTLVCMPPPAGASDCATQHAWGGAPCPPPA